MRRGALLASGGALLVACATSGEGGSATATPESAPGWGPALDADPSRCGVANDVDDDGDGYTEAEGDCDDCRRAVNPGAYDVPGNGVDEDCSGRADDEPVACDVGGPIDDADPAAAVRALGLCRWTNEAAVGRERTWGVVSARWVKPDGSDASGVDARAHGILPSFGVNTPLEGASMLALSTGTARAPTMPGYEDLLGHRRGYTSKTPPGYPKESPACPGTVSGLAHDGIALEIVVRAPTNVRSFRVDQSFFTLEFPGYVCSKYNDYYVLDVDPPVPGYPDGNVAFDAAGNPISVNNALLQVCEPRTIDGRTYDCPLGPSLLEGTGFDTVSDEYSPAPHASTGWLTTWAPVTPGATVRLRFAIWDSSDGNLDSTVLLDRFAWSEAERRGTGPAEAPR